MVINMPAIAFGVSLAMTDQPFTDPATQNFIRRGLERLREEFRGIFSAETVERFVDEALQSLSGARLKQFVPLFVNRFARERLQALAQSQGKVARDVPEVLFVCVHNAGRSQMAMGWFEHLAGDRAIAWSGGSEPGTQVNPSAVEVMREVGIDISGEFPKPWTDEVVRAADVVVTMGCGDACPVFPGKRYEDWVLDDPVGQDVNAVRPIRDEIERRVRALLAELQVPVVG